MEMKELIEEALKPGVSREDVFMKYVPRAHALQQELFERASNVPVVVSFWLEDVDERYTFEFGPNGSEAERGEMVDFPQVTIAAKASDWEVIREKVRELSLLLQEQRDALEGRYGGQAPLTGAVLESFERFQGEIRVTVDGVQLRVILNDYVSSSGDPWFGMEVSTEALRGVIVGKVEPRELLRQVQIKGQMSFALELAGFLSKHVNI